MGFVKPARSFKETVRAAADQTSMIYVSLPDRCSRYSPRPEHQSMCSGQFHNPHISFLITTRHIGMYIHMYIYREGYINFYQLFKLEIVQTIQSIWGVLSGRQEGEQRVYTIY